MELGSWKIEIKHCLLSSNSNKVKTNERKAVFDLNYSQKTAKQMYDVKSKNMKRNR